MERTKKNNILRWKKKGGGSFRLKDGKIIKSNQIFFSTKEDIPAGFLDTLEQLSEQNQLDDAVIVEDPKKPIYTKEHRSGAWWDVLDADGKKMNDKALKEDAADELISDLLSD